MNLRTTRRRGSILPLTVLLLFVFFAFVALSIDVGLMVLAHNQCQNAADAGAVAGARAINGNAEMNYNLAEAPKKAVAAAVANSVLSQPVLGNPDAVSMDVAGTVGTSGNVKVEFGAYAYYYSDDDPAPAQEGFKLALPRERDTDPWSAVRATVVLTKHPTWFARVLGTDDFNVTTTAVAVHRPRDVAIIMDLSGSMRFQSLPGTPMSGSNANPSSSSSARTRSLNPEAVFPRFGHYSNVSAAALQGTTALPTGGGEYVDPANISTTSSSGPPVIEDFHQVNASETPTASTRAFTRKPDAQETTPGGDNYLKTNHNAGGSYASTVEGILNTSSGPDNSFDDPTNANGGGLGYNKYTTFNGYTEGPGYWGKTFFVWPPDPRGSALMATAANFADNGAKDWRQRFFIKVNTSKSNALSWLDDNSILFDTGSGAIKAPGTTTTINGSAFTYRINYAAIFQWLKNTGANPFPDRVRAGRIRYYDAIPDPTDTNLNNRFWTTATLSDDNERFWKEYVDFVLGVQGTGAGTYTNTNGGVPLTAKIGNGDLYTWGTFQITSRPVPSSSASSYRTAQINKTGTPAYASGYTGTIVIDTLSTAPGFTPSTQYVKIGSGSTVYQVHSVTSTALVLTGPLAANVQNNDTITFLKAPYMNYRDNPKRPRHQFWFGPMTFVDFIGNYNTNKFWWPGNVHEAQAWACKVGIQSAIKDIKNNHPNDFISLTYFSDPKYSRTDDGQHNRAKVSNGRSYQKLIDSLWFPPSTVTGTATEISPYDADMSEVPRAKGGTAPVMGFMLAYNQLSSSATNLRGYASPASQYRGDAGGLGRRGAQRLIIFETDGAPNTLAAATLAGSGTNAYYPIRVKDPTNSSSSSNVEWPSNSGTLDSQLYGVVDQICALESANGFSTERKPVLIHCIAYGSLFEPANAGGTQTAALQRFQEIQYRGKTQTSASTPLQSFKRIYGTSDERIDRMKAAFTAIMQDGVQVSLIE